MTGCDYSNIRSDLRHVIAQSISNAHLTLHKAGSNLAKTKIIKTLAFQTISSHQLFTPTAKTRSAARSVARLATDTLSDPDRLPTYGNGAHVPNGTNLCTAEIYFKFIQTYTNLQCMNSWHCWNLCMCTNSCFLPKIHAFCMKSSLAHEFI